MDVDFAIKKMSRRIALLSIASTAGLIMVGCSNTAEGVTGTTPVAASNPAATPNPGSTPSPTPVPVAQPGTTLLTYKGHTSSVVAAGWSPDSKLIASTEQNGVVHVWEAATGKLKFVCKNPLVGNIGLSWSPDGSRIASEEFLNGVETVQIWAAENGRGLALNINSDTVEKVAWSPSSKYVALCIGSYQALMPTSRVEVRSAGGDSYKLTYKGHQPNVRDVAWSPDGSRIVSCSDDQTVQIWQAPV
ncbi:WD40 repeat domain-containing protein [Dictyobacter kobayashii]|nr:PD40 domain-containing protein [Dictyobacter kobayashii]